MKPTVPSAEAKERSGSKKAVERIAEGEDVDRMEVESKEAPRKEVADEEKAVELLESFKSVDALLKGGVKGADVQKALVLARGINQMCRYQGVYSNVWGKGKRVCAGKDVC